MKKVKKIWNSIKKIFIKKENSEDCIDFIIMQEEEDRILYYE